MKIFLSLAVAILVIGGGYIVFEHFHKSETYTAHNSQALLTEVGKAIVLPTDETPTIATVVDPQQLSGQSFFAEAQKNDEVLIYAKARKAVLWRPSTKQVISISAISQPST